MEHEEILVMQDIVKEFSGVRVLDKVTFKLRRGTVHALMGENGAGKSTLMKILNGIYTKTDGNIILNGQHVDIKNSKMAKKLGIAMIHQELSSFPDLSVSANMFMGNEFAHGFWIDEKEMLSHCNAMFEKIGIKLDPKRKLRDLSVAEAQMVEIAKAISMNADIIIMDEPTSAITEAEVEKLFQVIKDLRDGQLAGSDLAENLNNDKLISMMVGRTLNQQFYKTKHAFGEVALEVKGLSRKGKFDNVSFTVHKGEILGVAGLMGAGRTEVVETLFGMAKKSAGEILINGQQVQIEKPKDAIRQGIAFVSEDRKVVGLNLIGSICENITLANLKKYCTGGVFIKENEECSLVDSYIEKLKIKTENRNKLTCNLSGGNQQKVVLARWMSCSPQILILDEPTRGIDVGAKAEIYRLMDEYVAEGNSIIMVSSEMPEVLGMSDRIIVMHEGRLTGTFDYDDATQERIMAAASGI